MELSEKLVSEANFSCTNWYGPENRILEGSESWQLFVGYMIYSVHHNTMLVLPLPQDREVPCIL